jgi:hypothetical protein
MQNSHDRNSSAFSVYRLQASSNDKRPPRGWWHIGEGQTAPIMSHDMDPLLPSFVHFF